MILKKSLISLLIIIVGSIAYADVTALVISCERDIIGYQLRVTYTTPSNVYSYFVALTEGEDAHYGLLTKSHPDVTFPILLTGEKIKIEVPTVVDADIPVSKIRVTYEITGERKMTVVCDKGPAFRSLPGE